MKSLTTPDFWEAYARLPEDVREQARKAYKLWQENQSHPSLHFKKVGKNLWSARVTGGYRALALKKGDDYYWFWIGSHDEYETVLN
ncbi:type II toxin-antitoxin system RelE/ParE family toxin [Pelatocladus sp. BLCC-F211]|uniref:type II toxin-antitoxin system RelE family toxin n=1 Tax=Pelatocladus sp. BLCC-F211 TaxID=3342752 RepID=UPI0035B71CCE